MKIKLVLIGGMLLGLSACGFHFPNQNRLGNSLNAINVSGDYHDRFYKMVVNKLKVRGVKVNDQNHDNRIFTPIDGIPSLTITSPSISTPIVSVNSRGAVFEYNYIVKYSATLTIPNHNRAIVMRNGILRTTLNKADNSQAAENEREILLNECLDELSNQLIGRINYLGKMTDPDSPIAKPAQLLLAKGENNQDIIIDTSENLTLIEALQAQDAAEKVSAKSYELQELNNGNKVLNTDNYNLPKVNPVLVHSAPDLVDDNGYIKE